MRDVIDCMDPAAWDVEVVCPEGGQLWQGLVGRPSLRLRPVPAGSGLRPADAVAWLSLLRLVRRADIVHAHSSKAGFLVRSAALLTGRTRRTAFTPHGWSFLGFSGWKRRLLIAAERLAAHWCRTIVAVSDAERVAGFTLRIGRPEQYRQVLNGIDLSRFDRLRTTGGEHERVLVISRLSPPKRPELALSAFAVLHQTRPSARLIVAGEGPQRAELETTLTTTGLGPAVELMGHVDDVVPELERASCLLLTSSYEACPLAVLEAFAAGVPVIATRTPGTATLVEDGVTGMLVGDDPGEIAAAVARALSRGAEVDQLIERAQTMVHQRFSRQRMTSELLAVYDQMRS